MALSFGLIESLAVVAIMKASALPPRELIKALVHLTFLWDLPGLYIVGEFQ